MVDLKDIRILCALDLQRRRRSRVRITFAIAAASEK